MQYNISFAGAGRVASALIMEMSQNGYKIELIVSESERGGRMLAGKCNASWSGKLIFPQTTDVIIVSVPDHKLNNVLNNIICSQNTLVVHTAGSMSLDIFPGKISNKGIFYPLQTFSKGRKIDFKELPFLIESDNQESIEIMQRLAESIGAKVFLVDSDHRQMLHLAAVFTNNFTNHMVTLGKEVAAKAGFSFDLLVPLLKETILKALDIGPENSQTGPAIRNDLNTIKKQMELLSFSPEIQVIYREMTRSIIEHYKI